MSKGSAKQSILDGNQLTSAVAAVRTIPPDRRIYALGVITGTFHIYNTGRPAGGNTQYHLTITHSGYSQRSLAPGGTDTFNGGGNTVFIQNDGPSALQVLSNGNQLERPKSSPNLFMQSLVARPSDSLLGSTGDDAMNTLQDKWYNALVAGLGLNANTFQLLQSSAPLPFTSMGIWNIFNSIPPDSLTQVFSQSSFNSFYDTYRAVVMNLMPPDGAQFRQTLGDSYPAWQAAQKALKPGTNVLNAFNEWAQLNLDPGTATKASIQYQQLLNGTVGLAVKNVLNPAYIDANNGPIFSKTIQNLKDELTQAPQRTLSFDSSTASSDVSHTWASGSISGAYDFFRAGAGGDFDQLNTKASSSKVTVQASFGRVLSFAAAPGGWYSSAALSLGYRTPDNTVWTPGQQPDWESTFGGNGNLKRLSTELVVVDGIDATITSSATFSSSEQQTITGSASAGFWPFFSASASGGQQTSVSFDSSGAMTLRISVPKGNPQVLGVNVLPIQQALGG
ncbi:hypothetical protein D7V97_40890 [Corallococcus sp. CA053C]|nr:hypothetical protein D7V97_40890 [Corallococcus sp. CA053C]